MASKEVVEDINVFEEEEIKEFPAQTTFNEDDMSIDCSDCVDDDSEGDDK